MTQWLNDSMTQLLEPVWEPDLLEDQGIEDGKNVLAIG
jgi:hypothetical protein